MAHLARQAAVHRAWVAWAVGLPTRLEVITDMGRWVDWEVPVDP